MNLTELCIRKPVLAWMLMAATVLFGGVALTRIGISQYPDIDFPTITVAVTWEGASPEALESDVVEIIEEAVTQVEGIKSLSSTSRQGSAAVTIELDLARNVDLALQDVTAKVSAAARRLPRDIDPPTISKSNPEDQPILWLGLSGPFPQRVLSDYARYQLKEKLQTVPGVGEITLGGYLERNVRIWVDATRLDEKSLSVTDVTTALTREHIELPAGRLEADGREINVRVLGEALNLDQLRRIVVREVNNAPVYLSDVALVEDGFEDVRRRSRFDGQPAQGIGIRKQRGSNAVAVAQAVRAQLEKTRAILPPGMEIGINFDSTQFIEEAVSEIELELLLAILLTGLVCWLFLGSLSSTLNVVLAIPMSLLGTIGVIYFAGFTLNTFTLLGLSLAVGIVVDDAIMVMENIFRHAEKGAPRDVAAREGTKEITGAALAATIAVVAIFIPVAFMGGVVGRFFMQFGVTLSVAVLLSYVEAITLAPARCAQFLKTDSHRASRLGAVVDRAFEALIIKYAKLLAWALGHKAIVLGGAAITLVLAVLSFRALPSEFVPSQDQSRLNIRLTTAVGADLEETDKLVSAAERVIAARTDVAKQFVIVGGFMGGAINSGNISVTLVPPKQRALTQAQVAQQLRKDLNATPGIRAVIQDLSQAGFTAQRGFPVEFSVRGSDWKALVAASEALKQKLQQSGKVVDVDTNYQVGMPELRIVPDRARAADLGVSMDDVSTAISAMVGGTKVGKFNSDGRRLDVRLRLLANQRSRPEDLSRLRVRSKSGELVPLSALITSQEIPALQAVTRQDRERAITIYGNIAPGASQDSALAEVERLAKEAPTGTRVVLSGASVAFRDSMSSLIFALIMGILVAYMVLASQFNSFLHPITVLTILPLSVAGAGFALLATGRSLNIFSMIGLLLLMGIVKKNSIILVDYANQMRLDGLDAVEAMRRAGAVRLRPILMTSIATMMGAVPAALALGPGSETRAPMAVGVIGGLTLSTLLSLLVVPAFYVSADKLVTLVNHKRGRSANTSV